MGRQVSDPRGSVRKKRLSSFNEGISGACLDSRIYDEVWISYQYSKACLGIVIMFYSCNRTIFFSCFLPTNYLLSVFFPLCNLR